MTQKMSFSNQNQSVDAHTSAATVWDVMAASNVHSCFNALIDESLTKSVQRKDSITSSRNDFAPKNEYSASSSSSSPLNASPFISSWTLASHDALPITSFAPALSFTHTNAFVPGFDSHRAQTFSLPTNSWNQLYSPSFSSGLPSPYRASSSGMKDDLPSLQLDSEDSEMNDIKIQQIAEFALPEEDRLQSPQKMIEYGDEEKLGTPSYSPMFTGNYIPSPYRDDHEPLYENIGDASPVEYPSRTIRISKPNPSVNESTIKNTFGAAHIRNIYRLPHCDDFVVSFFDLRKAKDAIQILHHPSNQQISRECRFCFLKEPPNESEKNQGTLVVFNLDSSLTKEHLKTIFGRFGDILEIRETPNKKHHRFVEFYDVRDAERALQTLNRTEIKGKKIKIEISRPGGVRSRVGTNLEEEGLLDESRLRSSAAPSPLVQYLSPALTPSPTLSTASNATVVSPVLISQMVYPEGNRPEQIPDLEYPLRSPSSMDNPYVYQAVPYGADKFFQAPRMISLQMDSRHTHFKIDIIRIMSGEDTRTTCMIRNIPNKYTQKMLLSKIDETFQGKYDFFYLPIDFKNDCNVGYAFINFLTPEIIPRFFECFSMKRWEKFNSDKIIEITYARIQGKMQLVMHFQNSTILTEDKKCRPVLFHSSGPLCGQPEEFPLYPQTINQRLRGGLFNRPGDIFFDQM